MSSSNRMKVGVKVGLTEFSLEVPPLVAVAFVVTAVLVVAAVWLFGEEIKTLGKATVVQFVALLPEWWGRALLAVALWTAFFGAILVLTRERSGPVAADKPAALEILFDPNVDVSHTVGDPLSNRPGIDARNVRVVTSQDTDRLAVRVVEMRTVQGAWKHTSFAARYIFGFPAYLQRLDAHAEAVAGSEKTFALVEKNVSTSSVIRLRRVEDKHRDFTANASRAACITVEASAPGLGAVRTDFHVWTGFTSALYCEAQTRGHDLAPTSPAPRQPNSNELRLLGYYFAEGTEYRNYGFKLVTAETLDEWVKKIGAWEQAVFRVVDEFSPALAARFRTLNERATALPEYMTKSLLNRTHEVELRCHHARLTMLEKEILADVTPVGL